MKNDMGVEDQPKTLYGPLNDLCGPISLSSHFHLSSHKTVDTVPGVSTFSRRWKPGLHPYTSTEGVLLLNGHEWFTGYQIFLWRSFTEGDTDRWVIAGGPTGRFLTVLSCQAGELHKLLEPC